MPDSVGISSDVLPNGAVLRNNNAAFDPGLAELQAASKVGLGAAHAAQNVLTNLWDFIKVPGDVASGKYSLDEITRMAPGYALGLAGAGTPVGAATVPENALGIFGGTLSRSASLRNLARAQKLERQGKSAEQIFSNSGWFRGPDTKWRNVISDEGASLNLGSLRPNQYFEGLYSFPGTTLKLSDVLNHPELYSAYPELGGYSVKSMPVQHIFDIAGSFSPETKTIHLRGAKPERILSTLLHETQHGVQDLQDFTTGGNVEEFLPKDFNTKVSNLVKKRRELEEYIAKAHPEAMGTELAGVKPILLGGVANRFDMEFVNKLPSGIKERVLDLGKQRRDLAKVENEAYDSYKRLAGEVEARAVQEQLERRDWTTPVWQHEGYIPFEEQILKKPHRLIPVDHDPFVGVDQTP